MKPLGTFLILLVAPVTSCVGQKIKLHPQAGVERRGTCATVVVGEPGMSFVIDSRVTENAGGASYQYPGCKVVLARPSILLAGVGLVDTTGQRGRWNSLDEATSALSSLPAEPTEIELNRWGSAWAKSLVAHYGAESQRPAVGVVSEILLLSRVNNIPFILRTTVSWNGLTFEEVTGMTPLLSRHPQAYYAGLCRQFVVHNNYGLDLVPPTIQRTNTEKLLLDLWGSRKDRAKNITELSHAAYGLELALTKIDERIEGDHAVIAPPYSTAEWPNGEAGWKVDFNDECKGSSPQPTKPQLAPLTEK